MRNLKKFLALVLALVLAMSLMVTASAANPRTDYPDMDSVTEQFREAVDVLSGMGVFRGNNGSFLPTDGIMRCEAVAILYRLVTHDVDDAQVELYAPLAEYFNDVTAENWFAGYVGFCVDAGYIKGYNGDFNPYLPVTGYEMLAMLLRAAGYGKNGEFTGANWRINVGSKAQELGILANIQSTDYANTLSKDSPREVVAELTFQVATQVHTVTWTPAGGYNQYVGVPSAQNPTANVKNPTLGEREFGLASKGGIIAGNQGTGEKGTLLGYAGTLEYLDDSSDPQVAVFTGYQYPGSVVVAKGRTKDNVDITAPGKMFDFKTGLDQFAHEVKVWYDERSTTNGAYHTYALIDHVETEFKFIATAKGTTTIGAITGADSGNVLWSDRYSQIGLLAYTADSNTSPISTYGIVSNPSGTVYIALSSEVAQITQKNSTASTPYLILGDNTANTSTFGNGTAGTINISSLVDTEEDLYKTPGETVIVNEILGTSFTLTSAAGVTATTPKADGQPGAGAISYQLLEPEKKSITVASLKVNDNLKIDSSTNGAVITVNPNSPDALSLSGITYGDGAPDTSTSGTSEIISDSLPIVVKAVDSRDTHATIEVKAGMTYTAWLDQSGRFISLVPDSGYKFIYGTYADYDIASQGAGTINYNLVGVDENGKEQPTNPLKSVLLNITTDVKNSGTFITTLDDIAGKVTSLTGVDAGAAYSKISTTKKDQGMQSSFGNQIELGFDTGYWYNATTGDLAAVESGSKMTDELADGSTENVWVITAQDASNGFVKVTNGKSADGTTQDTEYLLTKDTKFHVVSGTGTATLEVANFTGLADFLQGATGAEISFNEWQGDGTDDGSENEVVFFTYATKYGSVNTGDNYEITDLFLSDGNLLRWAAQTTLYFNYDSTTDTGLVLTGTPDGSNVKQYNLWQGNEEVFVFVDDAAAGGASITGNTESFFVLSKIYEVNGLPVYKATLAPASNVAADKGVGNLTGAGFASKDGDASGSGVTYDYVAVSNLKTGMFSDAGTSAELLLNMDNVTVCDVEYKTGASSGRSEITDVLELNNAVSVGKLNGNLTYGIDVAVVYDTSSASAVTVYVLDVATNP